MPQERTLLALLECLHVMLVCFPCSWYCILYVASPFKNSRIQSFLFTAVKWEGIHKPGITVCSSCAVPGSLQTRTWNSGYKWHPDIYVVHWWHWLLLKLGSVPIQRKMALKNRNKNSSSAQSRLLGSEQCVADTGSDSPGNAASSQNLLKAS